MINISVDSPWRVESKSVLALLQFRSSVSFWGVEGAKLSIFWIQDQDWIGVSLGLVILLTNFFFLEKGQHMAVHFRLSAYLRDILYAGVLRSN